jgi:hypothetical protein
MGSSKIILVTGLCIMLGFYAYQIQRASLVVKEIGNYKVYETQSRLLAMSAENMAVYQLSNSYIFHLHPGSKFITTINGDTLQFIITELDTDAEIAKITATGKYGSITTIRNSFLVKHASDHPEYKYAVRRYHWSTRSVYTEPQTYR